MNAPTSIYLDLVRFMAAVTVFISHTSGRRFTGGLFWQTEPYAAQAVNVFFVLSGFVIAYVTEQREMDARSFAVSRLARIYSVALPALVVTFILDAIGRSIHPEYYAEWWGYVTDGQVHQFVSSLFFLNRLWWLHVGQGSNIPYWSLNYEVWYYVIFGLYVFGGRHRLGWAVLAALVAGPNILFLFPLWLLGVWAYRRCKTSRLSAAAGVWLCAATFAVWVIYEVCAHLMPLRIVGPIGPFYFPHIAWVQDYLVGVLFAVHLIGFSAASGLVAPLFSRLRRQIRWVAGATFTIYLFHGPLTQFFTTIMPWPPESWQAAVLMYPGTLVILFGIAEFTERRKDWWRALFARVLGAPAREVVVPQANR